ncbi:Uncharacterised protein [uncultured archaeon]|nr:Uncharacterised protein [uncultured archaeon]
MVDIVREMQEVTESEVLDARILIRTFLQSPLIWSDSDRPGILMDFIRLVDDAYEDVLDGDVQNWLLKFRQMQYDAIALSRNAIP